MRVIVFILLSNEGDNTVTLHRVELDSFYLGKYPVTFDQFDAFCAAADKEKPNDEGWGRGGRPVINVSWDDATDIAAALRSLDFEVISYTDLAL